MVFKITNPNTCAGIVGSAYNDTCQCMLLCCLLLFPQSDSSNSQATGSLMQYTTPIKELFVSRSTVHGSICFI